VTPSSVGFIGHEDTKTRRTSYRGSLPDAIEDVATKIVDAAFRVHSDLGPGLLESIYETCLDHELRKRGLKISKQVPIPIVYDTLRIDPGLRLDLLVEDLVTVEIKAIDRMSPVFEAQILSYLKLSKKRLGLLINFNVARIRDGIRRFAL
jgi:GxxExxY protein